MARKRPRKPRKPSGPILVCETCKGGGSRYFPSDWSIIIDCPDCEGTGLPHGSMESRNQALHQHGKGTRDQQETSEICSAEMDE